VTLTVTDKSGKFTKKYTIMLTRDSSASEDLSAIRVSAGTLSPDFNTEELNYTLSVYNSVTNVLVEGLSGDKVVIGQTLSDLAVGVPRKVTLAISTSSGLNKKYTVTVTRKSDNRELVAALKTPQNLAGGSTKTLVFEDVPQSDETTETVPNDTDPTVRYKITTKKQVASAAYDQLNLLSPATDVIYPGSVILQESIEDGTYKEITSGVKRPVTLSYSLTGVPLVSRTLVPSLSGTREFHSEVFSQNVAMKTTNSFQFECFEITNEDSFDIAVKAGASYTKGPLTASLKSNFNFSSENKKKQILVKFSQTYYTVDIDQSGDNFLFDEFDLNAFGGYRPTYISSVAYGRSGYLSVVTDMTKEELKTALEVSVDMEKKASGDVSVDTNRKTLEEKTECRINMFGSSSSPTTLEKFYEEVENSGFSKDNPGIIIAYKLRFLDDNTIANTLFSENFTARTVTPEYAKIKLGIKLLKMKCSVKDPWPDQGIEVYGDIDYKNSQITGMYASLWHRDSDNPNKDFETGSEEWIDGPEQTLTFDSLTDKFIISVHLKDVDIGTDDTCASGDYTGNVSDAVQYTGPFKVSIDSTICEFQATHAFDFSQTPSK
jgi:thiol-activated cytolysin